MTIHRKELEDLVFNETWKMLYDNNNLDALVEYICKLHQNETQESTVIKSLEKKSRRIKSIGKFDFCY